MDSLNVKIFDYQIWFNWNVFLGAWLKIRTDSKPLPKPMITQFTKAWMRHKVSVSWYIKWLNELCLLSSFSDWCGNHRNWKYHNEFKTVIRRSFPHRSPYTWQDGLCVDKGQLRNDMVIWIHQHVKAYRQWGLESNNLQIITCSCMKAADCWYSSYSTEKDLVLIC